MKTFTSSSYAFQFTGTRADAIKACKEFLRSINVTDGWATWRANDCSGFTITIKPNFTTVRKWNAARS